MQMHNIPVILWINAVASFWLRAPASIWLSVPTSLSYIKCIQMVEMIAVTMTLKWCHFMAVADHTQIMQGWEVFVRWWKKPVLAITLFAGVKFCLVCNYFKLYKADCLGLWSYLRSLSKHLCSTLLQWLSSVNCMGLSVLGQCNSNNVDLYNWTCKQVALGLA